MTEYETFGEAYTDLKQVIHRCSECGENFDTDIQFLKHLNKEHVLKTDK